MEVEEERSTTYTESHRRYYQAHKQELLKKYKQRKPWRSYYERNREAIKAKALARYHARKAATTPVADPPPQ